MPEEPAAFCSAKLFWWVVLQQQPLHPMVVAAVEHQA